MMGAVIHLSSLPTEAGLRRELTVSDVDRISHALGKLMAEAEESRRQRDSLFIKLDRLERENQEMGSMLRQHMADSAARDKREAERYAKRVEPTIEDYHRLKNRAIGVMAVMAALGAGAMSLLRLFAVKMGWL
jgi:hypothetical protein